MDWLVVAARQAVTERNWYAALTLALTLPDICGRLENPDQGSKERFVGWCGRYLTPRYTHQVGPDKETHVFLGGADCYALRCAVLHEGRDNIEEQRAREALTRFAFVEPPSNGAILHRNQHGSALQLQVDLFVSDVCSAVEEWAEDVALDDQVQGRIAELMRIRGVL